MSRDSSDESTEDKLCFTSVSVVANLLVIPVLFPATASSEILAIVLWSEDACDESYFNKFEMNFDRTYLNLRPGCGLSHFRPGGGGGGGGGSF